MTAYPNQRNLITSTCHAVCTACFYFVLLLSSATPCWGQNVKQEKGASSEPSASPVRVLCIDGGGVRGIIPARILQTFEEQAERPIHELFDIVIGTSTGGIIALAIAMPDPGQPQKAMYKAQDLVQFYLERSSYIFKQSIWRNLQTAFGIWGAKYNRERLDHMLEDLFKDMRLDQSLCHAGVLSYSVDNYLPHLWSSYNAQKDPRKNHYLRDAAGATSAAPILFAPKAIVSEDGQEYFTEVDGGIYANNPATAAMIAVSELYPDFKRDSLVMVSLGTGKVGGRSYDYRGLIGLGRLMGDMIDANSELIDGTLRALVPNYHQFQVTLPNELMTMDNGDKKHLYKLIDYTEQMLDKKKAEINILLKKLEK